MNDVTQGGALLQGLSGRAVVGDRAYDRDAILTQVEEAGMAAVIPARSHRKVQRALDTATYAIRNVIERWFGRVKVLRRIATRYEKTTASYASMLALASSLVALSGWAT